MVEYCIYITSTKRHAHITVSTIEDVEWIVDAEKWYQVTRIDNAEDCTID